MSIAAVITEEKKKRVNLTLDEDAIATAETLAAAENRSVSNLIETLIIRAGGGGAGQPATPTARSARLSVRRSPQKATKGTK
jgi:hypothetical protein